MEPFTERVLAQLKRHPKRLVFPEGNEPVVVRAAAALAGTQAVSPILLGDPTRVRLVARREKVSLDFVGIINPEKADDLPMFQKYYEKMQRGGGVQVDDARAVVAKPHHFAAMMVQYGQADALVGGTNHFPNQIYRAIFRVLAPLPHIGAGSIGACTVVALPNRPDIAEDGVLLLADTALIPEPSVDQLASIAVEAGRLARLLLGRTPRIALLSHSTKGSAATKSADKVAAATAQARALAKAQLLELEIDGELQVDCALVPAAAREKARGSRINGRADVLVFPDLNSGNIGAKLLEFVAGAQSYGHIVLGLSRPAVQLSRIACLESIVGSAAIAGFQAIKYHELYPHGYFGKF